MTLKFDRWPSKTIGHLFNATSSFVHHFVPIGEFKLELKSGNAQSGSNSTLFRAVWPWNLTDDLQKQKGTSPKHHQAICIISSSYVNSNWSYSPETVKLGVDLCDLDLWPWPFAWTSLLSLVITPENFMMIRWWEHGEQGKSEGFESCDRPIVRKRPIWVKIGYVLSRVTLKFDGWPWKTIGHLSFAVSSFVQHFVAIGEFKLELLSGNAQFG